MLSKPLEFYGGALMPGPILKKCMVSLKNKMDRNYGFCPTLNLKFKKTKAQRYAMAFYKVMQLKNLDK